MRGYGLGLLVAGLCALPLTSFAQWSENFDSYASGSQVAGQGGWKGWFNVPANGSIVSNTQALSAPNSLDVVGISDTVHEYSGYNTGQWRYSGSVFTPTNFTVTGEIAYFILLSNYSDAGTNMHWSVQLQMQADGVVQDTNGGGTSTPTTLVRGQWVPFSVDIDLNANTRVVKYNNITVATGTWFAGTGATANIGAVDLYANSPDDVTGGNTVPVYFDNLQLQAVPEPTTIVALGLGAVAMLRRRRK